MSLLPPSRYLAQAAHPAPIALGTEHISTLQVSLLGPSVVDMWPRAEMASPLAITLVCPLYPPALHSCISRGSGVRGGRGKAVLGKAQGQGPSHSASLLAHSLSVWSAW